MVCLFLLPVIAKITTDCLILIGCWKVSLNLIGCLKKLSRRTKWSTPLDWGGSGLYAGAHKKFVPFFWTHFISWQSVRRIAIWSISLCITAFANRGVSQSGVTKSSLPEQAANSEAKKPYKKFRHGFRQIGILTLPNLQNVLVGWG